MMGMPPQMAMAKKGKKNKMMSGLAGTKAIKSLNLSKRGLLEDKKKKKDIKKKSKDKDKKLKKAKKDAALRTIR